MTTRELIFSVTADDCTWTPYRGSGNGGQKKNKTSSAMRCTHGPSGAVGECEEHREQSRNKTEAFRKMAATDRFKRWLDMEAKRRMGHIEIIEGQVDQEMKRVKIDVKNKDGRWVEDKGEPA